MIRKLNQQYVITNYRTFPGQHLHHVVQSYDMRLVASVHTFLATPAGEHMRRRFLSNSASPYHWAKVPGLRVYLMLEGSMPPTKRKHARKISTTSSSRWHSSTKNTASPKVSTASMPTAK